MGLVFGQHHRAWWQGCHLCADLCAGLVAVGVAAGDQPRPPPRGVLPYSPVHGAHAQLGSAQRLVDAGDGPRLRGSQQFPDPLPDAAAALAGPSAARPVGYPSDAFGVVAADPASYGAWVVVQQFGDLGRVIPLADSSTITARVASRHGPRRAPTSWPY